MTITSELFGYTGVLTLFAPDRLDRFEVITPTDFTKTLGRYHARHKARLSIWRMPKAERSVASKIGEADDVGHTLDRAREAERSDRATLASSSGPWRNDARAIGRRLVGAGQATPERVVALVQ